MQFDSRGLAITTPSAEAAKNIDQAVKAYMDYGTTAGGHLKTALEHDPACVLALCIRGYFFLMLENKALLPRVKQTLDEIRPHLGARDAARTAPREGAGGVGGRRHHAGLLPLGRGADGISRSTFWRSSFTTP